MSPTIYTPHDCEKPEEDLRIGTMWQCDVCETIWEAIRPRIGEWAKISDPRRGKIVLDAARLPTLNPESTTPTVTPAMVQLVLDTYTDHMCVTPNDGVEPFGWCGECETGIYGPHTIQAHAREMTANTLQDALRGETRG